MRRRTKIVCTLGPAVDSREKIKALIEAGMNVARLNCSHGDWETKRRWIEWVRELSGPIAPVAILADLQGPKFRVGMLPGNLLDLVANSSVTLGDSPDAQIPIHQAEILSAMSVNGRLLLGDGEIELKIVSRKGDLFTAKVISGGTLKSRQGVTLVNRSFDSPSLTSKDLDDIEQAMAAGVDYIALSYVKSAFDIRELRKVVDRLDRTVGVCAKIETREACRNLPEILEMVDLVMVARGDMGLQMDIEEVPQMQKRIINECTLAGKPVITATQMLESMIKNPRPTRAEATDIFNAVLDGTDAVMLSGETAAGAYPIQCVKTMVRICEKAEALYDRSVVEQAFEARHRGKISHTDAIARAAARLTEMLSPVAVVTTSTSGQTPRLVSKFRPKTPILCATWSERTQNRMAVIWGVEAVRIGAPTGNNDELIERVFDAFVRLRRLKVGDQVVVTAGVPAGTAGNTNLVMIETVR